MVTRSPARQHAALAHTADVGLTAAAADLAGLFEEAAVALGELHADVRPGTPIGEPVTVRLRAGDLVALAFAWLNELIGLADAAHAAVATTHVERVAQVDGGPDWELAASVRLLPFAGGLARPRVDVKSATLHRLAVGRDGEGWRLVAYVDV